MFAVFCSVGASEKANGAQKVAFGRRKKQFYEARQKIFGK